MDQIKLKVLIIDDEVDFTEELHEFLSFRGFSTNAANTAEEGLDFLKKNSVDLLVLDVKLPGINGLDVLKLVKQKYPSTEVIIVSGHGDMDTVIKAMRLGAIDYLRKPFRHIDIQIAIERTEKYLKLFHQYKQIKDRNSLISEELEKRIERNLVGESQAMKDIYEMAMTAANYPRTNVLITGESGTGKENIARIIHFASENKDRNFCAVNSSAITESLLESEFFGHKKGSFTGASEDKKGFFEIANGGTLFLDEIADMHFSLQAKILRAIEEKKIKRVGENKEISVDFRIISATNHNIEKLIEDKKFRLDLFHRLNTITIHIPPLRKRIQDIGPLLEFFVEDFAIKLNKAVPKISPGVVELLNRYEFPGNVRELRNMVERAIIVSQDKMLSISHFPVQQSDKKSPAPGPEKINLNLEDNETQLILKALEASDYNQNQASKLLGISRDALIRRLKKYQIQIRKEAN